MYLRQCKQAFTKLGEEQRCHWPMGTSEVSLVSPCFPTPGGNCYRYRKQFTVALSLLFSILPLRVFCLILTIYNEEIYLRKFVFEEPEIGNSLMIC